jgi:hypothetical protein
VLAALVAFSIFVIVKSTHISRREQRVYDALAKEILEKHLERKQGVEKEVAKQVRKHVKKTFFLSEDSTRREMELWGDVAELEIFQKKSDARILESFTNATGFIQEELFYTLPDGTEVVRGVNGAFIIKNGDPQRVIVEAELAPKQRMRYFEADVAIYDYHTETLIAYNVRFKTYLLDGHELVKDVSGLKPETKGTARSMTMHHSERNGVQFSAENLNMEMTE